VGGHLARSFQGDARPVHGTTRRPAAASRLPRPVRHHVIDLTRRKAVDALVRRVKPGVMFHLAAQSSVADSWKDPGRTLAVNAGAQANLLAAAVELAPMPRVLVVGSTDEYGEPDDPDRALDEHTPLRPVTPYGVSKVAQDLLGLQYFLSHALPVIRVRAFNHTGPGQSPRFAVSSFARQIALIEAGRQPARLKVGNLDARRDFTDVRDIVRAYRIAVERGQPGEVYNIGSGRSVSLREVVDILLRMSRRPVTVTVDPARLRRVEPPSYRCDATRFRQLTGWQPEIPLEQTLHDTLEYWRTESR
jgi:GDP-4-dehydro-6-deoxy-D-mannose reductase